MNKIKKFLNKSINMKTAIIILLVTFVITITVSKLSLYKFTNTKNLIIWLLGNQPITAIGIFATLITAIIGYRKYRFEKNRDLYIQKLQKVYAPLYSYMIKQETSRAILGWNVSQEDKNLYSFKNIPIIEVGTETETGTEENCNSQSKITLILNFDKLLEIIKKETNYSFMSTNLINLLSRRAMFDSMYGAHGTNKTINDIALKMQREIEIKIVKDIFDEYTKCICKLGVDNKEDILNLKKLSLLNKLDK